MLPVILLSCLIFKIIHLKCWQAIPLNFLNKFECITNQQINTVVPSANFFNDFIYSRLENDASKISKIAAEQAVPIINKTTFSKVTITIPKSISEQIKIANFLTSIDEKIIEAQTYLDTVKQYKQGLLQQMFV